MTTTSTSDQRLPAMTPDRLLAAVVEQLMRSTDDELWVLTITAAAAPAGKLYAAVGRALLHCPGLLAAGTPVRCLLEGGRPDPQWRSALPPVERSLWAELQLLRTLTPTEVAVDRAAGPATETSTGPLEELLRLRLAVCDRLDTVG